MRVPADLALRLSGTASEAMAADTPPDRWVALLEAVAASPVRTTVKPAALPENPGEALLSAARQQAGRIPALTTLLGISMPPPPGPVRRIPPKPTAGGTGGRGPGGGPKRPPAPPAPPAAPAVPTTEAASAAPASPAETEADPAPPTPVHDESPSSPATPPAAEAAVEPAEPAVAPAEADVEAPLDVSVTADDGGPGAGEG
jgi:hypothetical protein